MSEKRQKKIALIAQMLAKAASTTPEEAEALTAAAEALMIAYQIESAELQAESGQRPEVVELLHILTGAQYADARRWSLALALTGLGQVDTYYRTNRRTGYVALVIVGSPEDAAQALRLTESLDRQQIHAMRAWWKNERRWWEWATATEQLGERRRFLIGFGKGVTDRLTAAREAATAQISNSTALVLVGNRARVDEHIAAMGMRTTRRRLPGSNTSELDGERAGREANTALGHELDHQKLSLNKRVVSV